MSAAPIESLLRALTAAGIRYLVVGGVAVVLHGYLRATGDLDLVLDMERSNLENALDVLERNGFRPRPPVPLRSFADPEERRRWTEEKNLQVFSLWHSKIPGFEIDLFVEEPFPFQAAYERASHLTVEGVGVSVVSIEDLIAMKRTAGRPKDLEDIDALLQLKREHERNS